MSQAGMSQSGWAWFEAVGDEAPPLADAELLAVARRWLSGPDAEHMMAHLRAITRERVLGPGAPGRALRYLEGQRALVGYLEALRLRAKAS